MKTFFNLIQEVQKPGRCHRCGGCATFCTAINYGALELDEDGKPRYGEIEKCIECGLCYSICPEIDELEEETKRRAAWSAPIGRVIETTIGRVVDPGVRKAATDGGVVTGLLLHLFDRGRIDGAIVTRPVGTFQRRPFLATSREQIKAAAGFYFDTSQGLKNFGDRYLTYSTIEEFDPMVKKGLNRVALVGTPCQIKSVRRMQALGLVPSDSIKFCFGLFCSGNFLFGEKQRGELADTFGFNWENVAKINIKEQLGIFLTSGDPLAIELDNLDFMRRHACRFCQEYSAEYADISFGGIGAEEGWTTILTRTPVGRAVFADARGAGAIEEYKPDTDTAFVTDALGLVRKASAAKKKKARNYKREVDGASLRIKD